MVSEFRASAFAVLFATAVLSGCSKDDSSSAATNSQPAATSASSAQADEDLSDISKYKLSMDKIDKYIQSQRNLAAKLKSMTPAERQALKDRGEASDANTSLDDMTAKIEKEPVMVDAIRAAGLSPREYIMITLSMMQTAMAASVAQMRPNDNQDSLIREMKANPENIKWYNEHAAEINQKTKAVEAEMKALDSDA
jgi:major membrane immunogen (membrane-anchored lipoprotein)